MAERTIGVLVMSYGTPESMDAIEAYYTHIRHGRPPAAEQLADLTARYAAIVGGVFPLRENTNKQVEELEKALNAKAEDGVRYRCYQGMKHASPFVEDGIAQMVRGGMREAVGIVLAPHYSDMSVGAYIARADEEAKKAGLPIAFVRSYHLHPLFIQALSDRVEQTLKSFGDVDRDKIRVLFTAHSLPAEILETNDPYPEQMLETSRAIADRTGVTNWQFAWQSAGQTPIPWLGPDILDVLETIAKEDKVQNVLVCPIGFVSDHLEVLYDIDIECKQKAQQLGMRLLRTESLNIDPLYIETLRDEVTSAVNRIPHPKV